MPRYPSLVRDTRRNALVVLGETVKLSIVIPVLNSHEIVRRQVLHYAKMPLPDDVELVLVDDGSDPPIEIPSDVSFNLVLTQTNDTRPWTQPKARNIGATLAIGDCLLFTDIDHIVPEETVQFGRTFQYGFCKFKRYLAVLDEDGRLTQNEQELSAYGVRRGGLRVSCHTLSMIVQADIFRKVGGFREQLGRYPTHDDGDMKRKLKKLVVKQEITKCPDAERPLIYVFPNGRFCGGRDADPLKMFHELAR
jgi:hypothetical protein